MSVQKKNSQIRVCIDCRNLNSAYPKDEFSLSLTELVVDATIGYGALSFMDGSLGYNQIQMVPEDEEVIAFCTPIRIYCYWVMPFRLKNVDTTYQRAMTYIFEDLLHDEVKCYVDDLVAKTKLIKDHIADLDRVFQ